MSGSAWMDGWMNECGVQEGRGKKSIIKLYYRIRKTFTCVCVFSIV